MCYCLAALARPEHFDHHAALPENRAVVEELTDQLHAGMGRPREPHQAMSLTSGNPLPKLRFEKQSEQCCAVTISAELGVAR